VGSSFKSLFVVRRVGDPKDTERQALQAELALMREENARIAVECASGSGPSRAVEQMRAVHDAAACPDGDEAWHAIGHAAVAQETLLDLFAELRRALAVLEDRIRSLPVLDGAEGTPLDGRGASLEGAAP
jgi:hypothetical protein